MNEPVNQQYRRLFKASPGKVLVLRPTNFEIVAVTDEYLRATMTREVDIIGKTLFEVFPDDPHDSQADGVASLSASLARVQSLKTPDIMGVQRYPVRLPDGTFEERFWSPVNSPVLTDAGDLELIMHRVEDVTAIVREDTLAKSLGAVSGHDWIAVQDIILRSKELRQALSKLQEYEARMRTAERLLNLGAWEFSLTSGQVSWSQQVFDIYGVPANRPPPDLEGYFALVHPDDQAASRAIFEAFAKGETSQIEFEHRVIGDRSQVKYVKGVGERYRAPQGEAVVGYVQDITQLIQTRQSLTQAESLLRLAGEKAHLGGWRVELDTGAVIWTPETAAIHGVPASGSPASLDDAIGYYTPEYRDVIRSAFERCSETGEAFDEVCQLQTRDGGHPWVRIIGTPERDWRNRIVAVQGACQDITSLREAQARADVAERQKLDILESITDAFYALDANWIFTYLNDSACVVLERSGPTLLGKSIWKEFPGVVGSDLDHHYRMAVTTQQTTRFQFFYPDLEKWFDVSAYPNSHGLSVYFREVTQERAQQEQLRLVDAALSRQNDIVMITTASALDEPEGPRIVYVNDAFERVTGYTKSEVMGCTPRILQGPDTDRGQLDRIRHALQNRESIRCEVRNFNKAGKPFWLELDITPLFDGHGHCTHFVAVERDITGRIDMEQQLRESQKLEAIGHLTGGVAHDFNNLLTVILGNAELLVDMTRDRELRSMAEMTLSAAQRGAELTNRLLAFARRQPLDPKPRDFNQLVTAMRALILRILPENIDTEFVLAANLGIIEIDAGELDTALLNLVVNARDAMQNGGRLTIETANAVLDSSYAARHPDVVPGQYVMICVSDTGTGMRPDTVRRAFEPFFTTKPVGKGSGLGLSMVFGFTKQSGGHIKIYSEPGEGTSIKLYFPLARDARLANYHPSSTLELVGGAEHILIAEDDDLVLQHLQAQLSSLGYRVTASKSGPEALQALKDHPDIDLLLTDVIMPGGMNGRQLADQATALYPALKVLFTSGYTENAIVHHGHLDPGVHLLSKPYTRIELATKVRSALRGLT